LRAIKVPIPFSLNQPRCSFFSFSDETIVIELSNNVYVTVLLENLDLTAVLEYLNNENSMNKASKGKLLTPSTVKGKLGCRATFKIQHICEEPFQKL